MLLEPVVMPAIELSLLDFRTELQLEQERAVSKARRYHDGEQLVFLTDRLKQFLSIDAGASDAKFNMNVCRTVVEAVAERLVVAGFECADPKVLAWSKAMWQGARLDTAAGDVHELALRDGESFVITDWDAEAGRVRALAHPRYTDTDADGDGFGVVMVYPNDDVMQKPQYAIKRWTEFVDRSRNLTRRRATVYYPDHIEKFAYGGGGFATRLVGGWGPVTDTDGEAWPLPWLGRDGKPLGLPVVHFKNKGLRSAAWDAIPLQDAVNKTLVDLLGAADLTAFRMYAAFGFVPTTDGGPLKPDGSNAMVIGPGQVIGSSAPAGTASFTAIDGQDLTPMLSMLQHFVLFLAMVTGVPVSRFQISGQVAAEGTLKQQEEPLMARVRDRQVLFGDAWEDVLTVARRIENMYGQGGLDETPLLETKWAESSTRDAAERVADLTLKKALGVPQHQLFLELGYSPEQADAFMKDPAVMLGSFSTYPAAPPAVP